MLVSTVPLAASISGAKQEDIIGTVVAYNHLNNLVVLTDVEMRVVLIVRIQSKPHDKSRFILVAYKYLSDAKPDEGGFPNALVQEVRPWRFKLVRDTSCDRAIQEFTSLQDARTGKDTDTRLPIWKLLPGAGTERLPFGETLPCYMLNKGDYKPYFK